MADKLRLGVIGAGSWAVASHLANFAQRGDEVELVAVARRGAEPLARVKERFGFEIASEDYRDVLAADVDICLVASPTSFHYEHARAALEAGAHVLVEKPFTISPAEAWELVDVAQRLDRHMVVAFGWNHRPMIVEMKRRMDDLGIGAIEQVAIQMASATRELLSNTGSYQDADPETAPDPATWTNPAVSGGGYAQAQLSHALGMALWLTDLRADAAFALMSAPLDAPVELHDAIALRFEGGAIGTLAGGSCHRGANNDKHQLEIRAIGADGQLQVDVEREIGWLWRRDADLRLDLADGDGAYDCDGPPDVLIDLALGRDVVNHSPGELAARTVEALDAVYRSAASGQLEPVTRDDAGLSS